MSDFYEDLQNISIDLFTEFGKEIALLRKITDPRWIKTYNPHTSAYQWEHKTNHVIVFVDPTVITQRFPGHGIEGSYKGLLNPGITVTSGDMRLYAVEIPEPINNEIIAVNGREYTVVSCSPVRPGAETILYDLQLR